MNKCATSSPKKAPETLTSCSALATPGKLSNPGDRRHNLDGFRIAPASSTFPVWQNSLLRRPFAQPMRKLPHVVRQFFQNKANNGCSSTLILASRLLPLRYSNTRRTKGTHPFHDRRPGQKNIIGLSVLTLTFAAYSYYPLFQNDKRKGIISPVRHSK